MKRLIKSRYCLIIILPKGINKEITNDFKERALIPIRADLPGSH